MRHIIALAVLFVTCATATAQQIVKGDIRYDGGVTFAGSVSTLAASEQTLTDGQITVTVPYISANPQTLTSDELTQVNGLDIGEMAWLALKDPANDVLVLKHGTGNLSLPGAVDMTLTHGGLMLQGGPTGDVLVVGGGGGSSSGASTAADVSVAATPSNYTAATPDVEAHLAGIDTALASVGGGVELVWTSTVNSYYLTDYTVPSDSASITLSGWTMDAGKEYALSIALSWSPTEGNEVKLYFNGDTTDANYAASVMYGNGPSANIVAIARPSIFYTGASGPSMSPDVDIKATISISANGYASVVSDGGQVAPGAATQFITSSRVRRHSGTISSINSITLTLNGGYNIKTGTRIRLYEMRDVQGGSYAPRWDVPAIDAYNASLAGYWPLSEWSSTRYDHTRAIAMADTNTVGWTTGVGDSGVAALLVRANAEYFTTGAPKRLPTTYFLSCWVRANLTGTTRGIWGAGTAATYPPIWVYITGGNKVELSVGHNSGASLASVTGTTSMLSGAWHHVAVWCDSADKVYLFVDGVEEGTAASLTAPLAAFNGSIYLGTYYDGGVSANYFDGSLQHAAMWIDLPFTSTEAAALASALYNAGTPAAME